MFLAFSDRIKITRVYLTKNKMINLPTELINVLHAFPHITFEFTILQDVKFDVDSKEYLETLVMVALFPLVILVLSMFGFLIYYCCVRLKQASSTKMKSSSCYCSVCLIVVFIMLALGSISVIVYGAIEVHEGVTDAARSATRLNDSCSFVNAEVKEVGRYFSEIKMAVDDLNDTTMANDSSVLSLQMMVSLMKTAVTDLPLYSKQDESNDLKKLLLFLEDSKLYRTIVTFSLIGIQGLICLFALVGICFRSRCFLLTAVFAGLLCLVISYVYIGTALMVNVAVADICVDPYAYILDQSSKFAISKEIVEYYLTCITSNTPNPFSTSIFNVTLHLQSIEKIVTDIIKQNSTDKILFIADNIIANVVNLQESCNLLESYKNCKDIHLDINAFIQAICSSTFEGIFILCIATLTVCFALTIVMCAAPQTWKRFTKVKHTEDLDLDDVFLPPPARQPSVSRTNNPLYISPEERYTRQISSNPTPPVATNTLSFFRQSEENVHLIDQPPPAYSPPAPGSNY